mgnify:CR=1 FL=1
MEEAPQPRAAVGQLPAHIGSGGVGLAFDVAAPDEYVDDLVELSTDRPLMAVDLTVDSNEIAFEALGLPGLEALASLTAHARTLGVPVILDAKRGDIDSTAAAYASAYLTGGRLAGDALTINPYLGMDSLEPFITTADDTGRGVFVLLKTSNSGSIDLQDAPLASGVPLYRHLANMLAARAGTMPRDEHGFTALGVVVGATHASHLAELRSVLPRSVFLVPGYGAQGGTADDVAAAFDGNGRGAVVSASRSLTYASGPVGGDPTGAIDAARGAVVLMRDAINGAIARR